MTNVNNVQLSEGKMEFIQEGDSCFAGFQKIDISIGDNGNGKFCRIETEGWSFDNVDELIAIIQQVQQAFNM